MVLAECVVVGALILLAWHVVLGAAIPGAAAPLGLQQHAEASHDDSALPAVGVPVADPNARGPAPGLNVGIGFWRKHLGTLNRDEAAFEALEWKITHAVMDAARDYLDKVVVPAVRRAEAGAA